MYSTNDWRYYLAHGWGTTPEQKAKERAYNTEYYQTHKYKWYGETKPDGSVEGYFDVNPGGEYEYDEEYAQTRRKKKKGSNPVSIYTKYVSKAYKKNGSKNASRGRNSDGSVYGTFGTTSGNYQYYGLSDKDKAAQKVRADETLKKLTAVAQASFEREHSR